MNHFSALLHFLPVAREPLSACRTFPSLMEADIHEVEIHRQAFGAGAGAGEETSLMGIPFSLNHEFDFNRCGGRRSCWIIAIHGSRKPWKGRVKPLWERHGAFFHIFLFWTSFVCVCLLHFVVNIVACLFVFWGRITYPFLQMALT